MVGLDSIATDRLAGGFKVSLWDRLRGKLPGGRGAEKDTSTSTGTTLDFLDGYSPPGQSPQSTAENPQLTAGSQVVWGSALQDTCFPVRYDIGPRYSYFTRQDGMAIRAAVYSAHLKHYHDAYLLFYKTTVFEEGMGGQSQTPSAIIDLNQPEGETIESRIGHPLAIPAPRKLNLPILTQLPNFGDASSPERTTYSEGFAYGFDIKGLPSTEFESVLDTLKRLKKIPRSHSVIYLVGKSQEGIVFYWSNYRILREAYTFYNAPAASGAKQQRLR